MITPCINQCELQNGVCISCCRTKEQIANWSSYSDVERHNQMLELIKNNMETRQQETLS